MTQQALPGKLTCFQCGKEIVFLNRQSRTRYNLDGTIHRCDEYSKWKYEQSDDYKSKHKEGHDGKYYSTWNRRNRYYWGFGPGKYHKENERRYKDEKYWNSRRKAEEQYKNWRNQYHTPYTISEDKALEILGLTRSLFSYQVEPKKKMIRDAYRELALKYHPDRKPYGNSEAFIRITTAYDFLMGNS